jgi:hypothetical protein
MKVIKLAFLICLFLSISAFAQTPKAIEIDLLRLFKKIDSNSPEIDKANDDFAKKLKYYTEKYPATLDQPFESLKKEHLDISTSTDGLFRIYSWDTWTGGTMHYFESLFQYKARRETKTLLDLSKAVVDDRPNYHNLYTFTAAGKSYYLAVWRGIGSTKDASAGITCFTIENNELKRSKILKTSSGLHDELAYWYNFFSVVDIDFEKRPDISFDNQSKTIYLPLIDKKGSVTNRKIAYKFTGKYFEKVKN